MTDSYIVTPAAVDVPVVNLVPNPSFEVDTFGWTALTRGTGQPVAGTHSASAFVPSGTAGDIALSELISVAPSTPYRLSYYAGNDSGTIQHDYGLKWYQADGTTFISETVQGTQFFGDYLAGLARSDVAGMAAAPISPSDAAFARVHVTQHSVGFGNTAYVDAFMLTEGTTLYDYFDGDTVDDASFDYSWAGPAHASPSIRTAVI